MLLEMTANLGFALQYLEKDEAVQFLSYFDSLTGLAKRPLFCQRLARLMADDTQRSRRPTVVVFDVQKLGAINDSLGRYVGDRLLEKIAARIKQTLRELGLRGLFRRRHFRDHAGTAGGRCDDDTGRLLQSAAAQLFAEPFLIDEQELRPPIRSGVAFYPHDAATRRRAGAERRSRAKAAREDNEKYMLYGFVTQRPTSRTLALEARLAGRAGAGRVPAALPAEGQHRQRQDRRVSRRCCAGKIRRRVWCRRHVHPAARAVRRHRRCG